MSYTFRVVFDGVCAYVPDEPFFIPTKKGCWKAQENIESMAVLLPDLRRPGKPIVPQRSVPQLLNFPSFREPHFPLLTFRLDDLREGTTRRVDLVCRDISEKDEAGLLFLRREQIRFCLGAENNEDFDFANWVPLNPLQRLPDLGDREQLESLWWLPDLNRIVDIAKNPDAARAKPEVLPSYRGPFPEGLIARVECSGGRLRTFDFNRGVDGFPLPWRFAEPTDSQSVGVWNRALSNSLALEFFDVSGPVHIELKRLANEVVIEELVLAPAPGASRPVLEISISNREPDLLFQEEGFSRSTLPDLDFQPFYEMLSAATGSIENLPIPNPGRFSFLGIQEKPCAGTLMAR